MKDILSLIPYEVNDYVKSLIEGQDLIIRAVPKRRTKHGDYRKFNNKHIIDYLEHIITQLKSGNINIQLYKILCYIFIKFYTLKLIFAVIIGTTSFFFGHLVFHFFDLVIVHTQYVLSCPFNRNEFTYIITDRTKHLESLSNHL